MVKGGFSNEVMVKFYLKEFTGFAPAHKSKKGIPRAWKSKVWRAQSIREEAGEQEEEFVEDLKCHPKEFKLYHVMVKSGEGS